MQLWSPSLVFSKHSLFLFSVCLRTKVILPLKKEKKNIQEHCVTQKKIQQKAASAAASIGNVERYNKTTQHAFTTFIGSEI